MEALLDWGYIGLFIGSFVAGDDCPVQFRRAARRHTGRRRKRLAQRAGRHGRQLGGRTDFVLDRLDRRWEWIEKYLRVKHETLERHKSKVDRFGAWLALFTWLPFVGDVFAVALGFYRVNFRKSAVLMLVGKGARFVCWALLFIWGKDLWG